MLNTHVNPLGQDLAPVKDAELVFKNRNQSNTSLTFQADLSDSRNPELHSLTRLKVSYRGNTVTEAGLFNTSTLWWQQLYFGGTLGHDATVAGRCRQQNVTVLTTSSVSMYTHNINSSVSINPSKQNEDLDFPLKSIPLTHKILEIPVQL